jgi:hypothetical protein
MSQMDEVSNPRGRPSEYSQAIADRICAEIASGSSLRTICRPDEMPAVATIFNWFRRYPDFLEQYTRAKEEQADAMAEEMLDIADDANNDWMERRNTEGENIGWQINGEHVQRSRLRIETRKWLASKLKAKKYGDKVEQTVKGDPNAPLEHNLTVKFVD